MKSRFYNVLNYILREGRTIVRAMELDVLDQLKLKLSGKWIDLGSGTLLSCEYGHIDYCDAEIQLCDLYQQGANVMKVDLNEPLPFENNSAVGIILSHSLQYVHNVEQALLEVARIAREKVVIILPYSLNYAPEGGVDYLRFRSDFLSRKLTGAGFKQVNCIPLRHGPLLLVLSMLDPFLVSKPILLWLLTLLIWPIDSLLLAIAGDRRGAVLDRCVIGYICIAEKV